MNGPFSAILNRAWAHLLACPHSFSEYPPGISEVLSSDRITEDYALYQSSFEDTEWSRILEQTRMPLAAFSCEAGKRTQEATEKLPASGVTYEMILNGTHLKSTVKEDVRSPTRWALDVRKLQRQRKPKRF